jgi:hypothetical protein
MTTGTGTNVSKAVVETVLTNPPGTNASKAMAEVVLSKPPGVNVSKAMVYVVLIPLNTFAPDWDDVHLADGVVGSNYQQVWNLYNSSPTGMTYSVVGGSLPPGIGLNFSTGTTVGSMSGIPTTVGTYNFTLRATNVFGSADKNFTVQITAPASSAIAPVIWAQVLQSGKVGHAYSEVITFTYGVAPYTLSVSSGALPPGITLNTGTKTLEGTPTTAGTFNFNLHVVDNAGNVSDQSFAVTIEPASQGNSGWAP